MNEQLNIFSVFRRDFRINNKIRLIELFAGVGSQAMALKKLGADFEHYKVVEFDKYAIKSYNAIHGTDFEPTDITQISGSDLKIVDTETFTYLLTYSFPCQDLSVAGKQKGMVKGSGTQQIKVATQYRIRKLTPKECWRLMDFSDEDFEKAEKVNSNTQLYKQAGNSIVVNVLVAILGQLLQGKEDLYKEIS